MHRGKTLKEDREQIWFCWMILELSGTQGYGDNRSGADEQCLNTWENLLIFLKSHIIVNMFSCHCITFFERESEITA